MYEYLKGFSEAHSLPAWPCGVVAGIVAGALTNPMDLVKTRLQVARADPSTFQYRGSLDCCAQILKKEGALALFDGVGARILMLTPRLTLAVSLKEALFPLFLR